MARIAHSWKTLDDPFASLFHMKKVRYRQPPLFEDYGVEGATGGIDADARMLTGRLNSFTDQVHGPTIGVRCAFLVLDHSLTSAMANCLARGNIL